MGQKRWWSRRLWHIDRRLTDQESFIPVYLSWLVSTSPYSVRRKVSRSIDFHGRADSNTFPHAPYQRTKLCTRAVWLLLAAPQQALFFATQVNRGETPLWFHVIHYQVMLVVGYTKLLHPVLHTTTYKWLLVTLSNTLLPGKSKWC
jgi:hypothetical protein